MLLSAAIPPVKVTNGRQAALKYSRRVEECRASNGRECFSPFSGRTLCKKFGKCGSKEMGAAFWSVYAPRWHAPAISESGEQLIVLLSSLTTNATNAPAHPFICPIIQTAGNRIHLIRSAAPLPLSLPTAPFPPFLSHPPATALLTPAPLSLPPHCRNRICRNHSKARYNLLLAVHNTPLPLSPPFLNRTRCPADELIILEILFLLLIPPFYEQLLFMARWI